jgi:hypothetical protein
MGVELHNVGLQSLVLRMTQAAFTVGDTRLSAVITRLGGDILAHLLVTIHTQGILLRLLEIAMAALAVLFIFVVRLAQCAGTQHALQIQVNGQRLQRL